MSIERRVLYCIMAHPNQSSLGAIEGMMHRSSVRRKERPLERIQILSALRRLMTKGKIRRDSFDNYSRLVPLEDS